MDPTEARPQRDLRSEIDRTREAILQTAARYGASNLRLFGSVARHEERSDSDVDLLATFETGRSLLDLIGLEEDLSNMLHAPVEIISEGGMSPYLRDRILAEAVPL